MLGDLGDIGDIGVVNRGMFPMGVSGLGDDVTIPFFSDTPPVIDITQTPDLAPPTTYSSVPTSSGDYQVLSNGQIFDPSGKQVAGIPQTVTGVGANSGMTARQLANLLATTAQGASAIYRATQSPSLIPGTALVWNPSTNSLVPASGISATGLFGTGFNVSGGLGGMLPILLIGGLILVMMAKR